MKRVGNIYDNICSIENLKTAHINASKDKRFYKEVRMVNSNPDYYLREIQKMLINETYEVSPYAISIINDSGKERVLEKLPYYPDRIIQWAILQQIDTVFLKTFCNHTCASIPGRGIHYAYKLVRKYLQDEKNTKYCLKLDVQKFYPSINHNVLKEMLRKKFKDDKLLKLLDKIIDSKQGDIGLPIGSYLSQYLANYYLCYFDHMLKEKLKLKYVVRYMDDIIILSPRKKQLHAVLHNWIMPYFQDLKLLVKDNYQIFPVDIRGIDFVGYRFFRDYTLLRKDTIKRIKRVCIKCLKNNKMNYHYFCSINSYLGWLQWCDSWRFFEKYIELLIPLLRQFYRDSVLRNRTEKEKDQRTKDYINRVMNRKGMVAA